MKESALFQRVQRLSGPFPLFSLGSRGRAEVSEP